MSNILEQRERIENGLLAGLVPMALRSLRWEQRAVEATQAANHKALHGENIKPEEGDEMIVLGDYSVTNSTTDTERKTKIGGLAKLAIGAALFASGVGTAAAIPFLIDGGKDVIGDGKAETVRYLLDLGGGRDITSEGTD